MSFFKRLFRSPAKVLVCDICDRRMDWGQGHILSTTQVLSSESFWKYHLTHQGAFYHEEDPEGDHFSFVIEKKAEDPTNWLICDVCAGFFDCKGFPRCSQEGLSLPGGGPANPIDIALVAAYAWSSLYDAWPSSIQLYESPPPIDGSVCDFCRRRVYPEEEVQLFKRTALETYESKGGLQRRGEHSIEIDGNYFWVACPLCINRAHRIMEENLIDGSMSKSGSDIEKEKSEINLNEMVVMCSACGHSNMISKGTPSFGTSITCNKCREPLIPVTRPEECPYVTPRQVELFLGYTDCSLLHVKCPVCREINCSIVVPVQGFNVPFYWNEKQKNPNAAFVVNVKCHHCSKPFVIEWDQDPRYRNTIHDEDSNQVDGLREAFREAITSSNRLKVNRLIEVCQAGTDSIEILKEALEVSEKSNQHEITELLLAVLRVELAKLEHDVKNKRYVAAVITSLYSAIREGDRIEVGNCINRCRELGAEGIKILREALKISRVAPRRSIIQDLEDAIALGTQSDSSMTSLSTASSNRRLTKEERKARKRAYLQETISEGALKELKSRIVNDMSLAELTVSTNGRNLSIYNPPLTAEQIEFMVEIARNALASGDNLKN